jgi:broad specificity phosphatase PhoE
VSARVRLVRHGEPLATIGSDPGLSALGLEQAAALVGAMERGRLFTSPLRRARETAAPLAAAWAVDAIVDEAVRELPSPGLEPTERRDWLRRALHGTFADLDEPQRAWRDGILTWLRSVEGDVVVTTHAVVINAVVGAATGDDHVLHFTPAHTSITVVEVGDDGSLTLVERGRDAHTTIR